VCSRVGSFVVDLSASTGLFPPLSLAFSLFVYSLVLVFILIPFIKACHALCHHVLALELDMDVFTEVLEPLVTIPILEATHLVVNINDENSLVERRPKRILDCE